ncbi:E3 ubiquitin-protein ligase SIAH1A-like [Aethina tumida]|uniref:E3 ubiquitin-protein ligase SIAH1A-like n=1 Tax=Aethina tumida TaxID=116153 RepID=UPI002147AB2A|nr:E3 ubiquitin-protein ligase SIAH1A-like [Aethina tumida]
MTEALDDRLTTDFQCSVCFDIMKPPIKMCINGHSCCESCHQQIKNCAECRGHKIITRNVAAERLFNKIVFPCRHARNGCMKMARGSEIVTHERRCDFISYPCPFTSYNCRWTGAYSEMEEHLRDTHMMMIGTRDVNYLERIQCGAHYWRKVVKYDGHLFIICFVVNDKFSFGVYLVADVEGPYYYKLTFLDYFTEMKTRFCGVCTIHGDYVNKELSPDNYQDVPMEKRIMHSCGGLKGLQTKSTELYVGTLL